MNMKETLLAVEESVERDNSPSTPRLHLAHLFTIPSSARLIQAEIEFSISQGHKVVVIAGAIPPDFKPIEDVEYLEVPALTRRVSLRSDFRAARQLAGILKSVKPDILHTHMPKTGWIGRVIGRLFGVPVVINTCHGLYARLGGSRISRCFGIAIEAISEMFAHVNLFQNTDDLDSMKRSVPFGRRELIGNGVDPSKFILTNLDRENARAWLGLDQTDVMVCGVGRLISHKGVRHFEALADSLAAHARFYWVGPEEPDKARRVQISSPNVKWLGQQSDMKRIYAATDIFVLPSEFEGVPRSAMEAGSAAVPAVLFDIPGCRDLHHGGLGAILVKPGDKSGLEKVVRHLVSSSELRVAYGKALQQSIRAHHNQLVIARELDDLYRVLHAANRPRRS